MGPDKEIDYIKLKDDHYGIHFGLYQETKLVSGVSLFINNQEAQFRKFATLQEEQGKGYGSKLLDYVLNEAKNLGVMQEKINSIFIKNLDC
ncbi:GNAT family N-acetyltransferase [Anaerobacillus alkalilacustris]|uniref:GNAT family N-acetyltransferase n=1 Tax=Anaerobacillus alkalilacustris TaxID=393763 RepID=UPI00318420D6